MKFDQLLLSCVGLAATATTTPTDPSLISPNRCVGQLETQFGQQVVIPEPVGRVLEQARDFLNPKGPLVELLEQPSSKLLQFHSKASHSLRPLEECQPFEAAVSGVLDDLACMQSIADLDDKQYVQFKKAIGASKTVDDVFAATTLCKFMDLLAYFQ